jgi:glycosyltransferase involved in cell wall biosynthesis
VVVDSGSTDRTVEIARRFGCEVFVRTFDTYIDQKNHALDRCRHDWVLSVDADEVITPDLAAEIQQLDFNESGYWIGRTNFLGDRPLRRGPWLRDDQLRLFRKPQGRWGGSNPHERVLLDGPAGRLSAPMLHYSYRTRQEFLDRNRKYTQMMAAYLAQNGRTTYRGEAWGHAAGNFFKNYVLRRGCLDGATGLFVAYQYARFSYLKYTLLAELQGRDKAAASVRRAA